MYSFIYENIYITQIIRFCLETKGKQRGKLFNLKRDHSKASIACVKGGTQWTPCEIDSFQRLSRKSWGSGWGVRMQRTLTGGRSFVNAKVFCLLSFFHDSLGGRRKKDEGFPWRNREDFNRKFLVEIKIMFY